MKLMTNDDDETEDDVDDETDDIDDEDVFCDLCDCKVTSKKVLNKHIQAALKHKTFKCYQCDHMAIQKSSLEVHVKSQHEGVKCEMKYTAKSSLASLVKAIHEGQCQC